MTVSAPGFPVALSPAEIDRELAAMWKEKGDGEQDTGVTRVALGNVIWLASARHGEHARALFGQLVNRYPCRLILLEYFDDRDDDGIDAFINARCFLSRDIRGEVCCEEIALRFGERAFPHVPGAILPLLLPDLPTSFLLVSSAPRRYDALAPSLTKIADRTITEVTLLDDPVTGLRDMARGDSIGTLSWFRDMPIREQIASLFDDQGCGCLLSRIDTVRLKWIGRPDDIEMLTSASLLAGWMAAGLGWKPDSNPGEWPYRFRGSAGGVSIELLSSEPDVPGEPALLAEVELSCSTGDRVRLHQLGGGEYAERVVTGPSRFCTGKPLFVEAGRLDEANALGHALNCERGGSLFRDSAELAWPVLEAAIRRSKQ